MLKIRRAILSVSDKTGVTELGRALASAGAEIVASGGTAKALTEAGLEVVPIERLTGNPEAFQGRMKTLSFPVCSGILYRRGDASDEKDLAGLGVAPVDCVVVNFYPFEQAVADGKEGRELIEQIDIGGPTLVRSAAKNAPDVLVLTDPAQYAEVIAQLESGGAVKAGTAEACARAAWDRIHHYDRAIAEKLGGRRRMEMRYGENPHQHAMLEYDADSPIAWDEPLTDNALSYNNILDLSAAYALAGELQTLSADHTGVVIVKHNNPCGVAWVPRSHPEAQKLALLRAWEGDPVSSFGGVLVFTDPLEAEAAEWLAERFVEVVAAPGWNRDSQALKMLASKRKRLKAVTIRRFGGDPASYTVDVPGGKLIQSADRGLREELGCVTKKEVAEEAEPLMRFGVAVCRALKSNAIALVREVPALEGSWQLVGAGQGQPNRVEALKALAIPRAQSVLRETGGRMADLIMISDAFFPFRDTVDTAAGAGIRTIVQPGGSIKDKDSIQACDEQEIAMVFTGTRHFRH